MLKKIFPFLILTRILLGGWAEETLERLSIDEKIGQLFVIPIKPPRGEDHLHQLNDFLKKYPVGNVILKQAEPEEQITFLNRLQKCSHLPLLTLADAEWGLGMRMKNTISYPRNLTLGALQDESKLYQVGYQIAKQACLVGIHLNLAPVADVNTNPQNPVIHTRSFGDNPRKVGRQVTLLMKGMQEGGLFACVKHFPGHGDTEMDSHHDLPVLHHDLQRLRKMEWAPFKAAIEHGVKAVMSAHLLIPTLDTVPCTFSRYVVTDLLKDELGFKGLVITDALNMKALTNYFSAKEIALQAFLAGHNLLLYGSHKDEEIDSILNNQVPDAFEELKKACVSGKISESALNERVLKILKTKEELGLHHVTPILESLNIMKELHLSSYYDLRNEIFEEAITLYRDEGLPDRNQKIAYFQLGKESTSSFFSFLNEAFEITSVSNSNDLGSFTHVIIGYYGGEFTNELMEILNEKRVYIAHFHSPYSLPKLPKNGTVFVSYEANEAIEMAMSQMFSGKKRAKGKLPVKLEASL